jgi:Glycosyl transferases group 1
MAGLYLKQRFGIPWVADFRDPWSAGRFLKRRWIEATVLDPVGESLVFKWADAVVVNAPNAMSAVVAKCPHVAGKIHCITNGFDPAAFAGAVRKAQARFVVAHTGELYAGRDPRPFLDAVQLLLQRDAALGERLSIEFIGNTSGCGFSMEEAIASRGLGSQVKLVGQVPYQESVQRMVDADVLLLIDSPNRNIGVPAKLYEYFGARRPVIALAREKSDVHWALRESGVPFRLANLNNVEQIASALGSLIHDQERRSSIPGASRFSRSAIALQLAGILGGLRVFR